MKQLSECKAKKPALTSLFRQPLSAKTKYKEKIRCKAKKTALTLSIPPLVFEGARGSFFLKKAPPLNSHYSKIPSVSVAAVEDNLLRISQPEFIMCDLFNI